MKAQEILEQWQVGLLTQAEAQHALEAVNVHGGFNDTEYTGYDYTNQQWITTEA